MVFRLSCVFLFYSILIKIIEILILFVRIKFFLFFFEEDVELVRIFFMVVVSYNFIKGYVRFFLCEISYSFFCCS